MSDVVRIPDAQSTPVAVASAPPPPPIAPATPPPASIPEQQQPLPSTMPQSKPDTTAIPEQRQPTLGTTPQPKPSIAAPSAGAQLRAQEGTGGALNTELPEPLTPGQELETLAPTAFPLIPGDGGKDTDNNFGSWDIGDDPEAGDEPTDDELDAWDAEAAGGERTLSSAHPRPGTIIGFPYQGTHGKAFNIAGGSDNWQSENAVDVWLFPGTEITAVEHGIVSPGHWGYGLSGFGGRFAGYRLHIVGRSGRVYFYTHLAGLAVVKGQTVSVGEKVGDSGIANGVPHLHFAVSPPNLPQAYVQGAFNIGHRTSVGTSAKTGKPPQKPKPQGSTNQAWRNLLAVFRDDIPAAASEAEAVIRRTRKAIT